MRFAVQRDFIQPSPVDDERFLDTHGVQCLRDASKHSWIGYTKQLHLRPGGVDTWTEQIDHCSDLELPANNASMPHSRMVGGSEQKAEVALVERSTGCSRVGVDLRPALRARQPSHSGS